MGCDDEPLASELSEISTRLRHEEAARLASISPDTYQNIVAALNRLQRLALLEHLHWEVLQEQQAGNLTELKYPRPDLMYMIGNLVDMGVVSNSIRGFDLVPDSDLPGALDEYTKLGFVGPFN
jgi:hypothetical protein